MNKRVLFYLLAMAFLSIGIFLRSYLVYSFDSAVKCEKTMLNEFGWQINSRIRQILGSEYSDFMTGPVLDSSKSKEGSFAHRWVLKTPYGDLVHLVRVPEFGLCPALFDRIEVSIIDDNQDIFRRFADEIDRKSN